MTISTQANRTVLLGNGVTTVFNFSFVGDEAGDITVIYTDSAGNQLPLGTSQYSIVLNAPGPGQLWGVGGAVTYPLSGTPIASGTSLTIERLLPLTQEVAISNQGAFTPSVIEAGMDTLEMQIQQVNDAVQRSLQVPVVDQALPVPFPAAAQRANLYAGFDAAGQPTVLPGPVGGSPSDVSLYTSRTSIAPVLRQLQKRFADHPSVLDWAGVDPTGASDSTAGLNTAVAACLAQGMTDLYFPAGNFVVGTSTPWVIGAAATNTPGLRIHGFLPNRTSGTPGMIGGTQILDASTVGDTILVNSPSVEIDGIGFGSAPGVVKTNGVAIHAAGNAFQLRNFMVNVGWNGLLLDGISRYIIHNGFICNIVGTYGMRLQGSSGGSATALGLVERVSIIPSEVLHTPAATTTGLQIGDNSNSGQFIHVIINWAWNGIVVGDGTADTPNFNRLLTVAAENCLGDGFLVNGCQETWFEDCYSSINNGNGVHLAAGLDAIGFGLWFVAPRVSGNGLHGFNCESFPGVHILSPRCATNSNAAHGGVSNTSDNINISSTVSGKADGEIRGGSCGGGIHEDPTQVGSARYGIRIEATVTAPALVIDGVNVMGNRSGGISDLSAQSMQKSITYVLDSGLNPNNANAPGVDMGSLGLNGNFSIWQRGTTIAVGAIANGTPGPDGWVGHRGANAGGMTITQQPAGPHGTPYWARVSRDNATSDINLLALGNVFETVDSIPLAGQTLRIRFTARMGALFSANSQHMSLNFHTGTGTDQSATSMIAGTWTGNVTQQLTTTLTTAAQDFMLVAPIPVGVTQIGYSFQFTPVGTAGATDYFELGAVDIRVADGSNDRIVYRDLGEELWRCRRRYQKSFPYATVPAQNAGTPGALACILPAGASGAFGSPVTFSRQMRATPTVTTYNPSAANSSWRDSTNGADRAAAVINAGDSGFAITGAGGVASSVNSIGWDASAEYL